MCEASALINSTEADDVWSSAAHRGLTDDEIQILSSLQRLLIPSAQSRAAELYHIINPANEVFPLSCWILSDCVTWLCEAYRVQYKVVGVHLSVQQSE